MFADRMEARWIDAFARVFDLCKVQAGDAVAILSETQSRPLNVHLAELALLQNRSRPRALYRRLAGHWRLCSYILSKLLLSD